MAYRAIKVIIFLSVLSSWGLFGPRKNEIFVGDVSRTQVILLPCHCERTRGNPVDALLLQSQIYWIAAGNFDAKHY